MKNLSIPDMGYWKKPGLVKEAIGKLGDLTPERLYHHYSRENQTQTVNFSALYGILM
jgi:hypothetical protein